MIRMEKTVTRPGLFVVKKDMNAFAWVMALLLVVVLLPLLPVIAVIWFVGWLRGGERTDAELTASELDSAPDSLA